MAILRQAQAIPNAVQLRHAILFYMLIRSISNEPSSVRRKLASKKLSRRGFLTAATIGGGVLVAGGITRQIHNQIGRDFQPERAQAYLQRIQPA
jgi:hypothetical protein